jgi:hypothetical protein
VSRSDGKSTRADEIASRAENLEVAGRIVGDATVVLLVLGVSEENGTNDLVADCRGDVADSGSCESGTLSGGELVMRKIVDLG